MSMLINLAPIKPSVVTGILPAGYACVHVQSGKIWAIFAATGHGGEDNMADIEAFEEARVYAAGKSGVEVFRLDVK